MVDGKTYLKTFGKKKLKIKIHQRSHGDQVEKRWTKALRRRRPGHQDTRSVKFVSRRKCSRSPISAGRFKTTNYVRSSSNPSFGYREYREIEKNVHL